jgi:hypothetical protein
MNTSTPHRKVVAGGLAGAISLIAVWALEKATGITVPAEIALSINTVFVFLVQYSVKNRH